MDSPSKSAATSKKRSKPSHREASPKPARTLRDYPVACACLCCAEEYQQPGGFAVCSVCARGVCPTCALVDKNGKPNLDICDECKVLVCVKCTNDWTGWHWSLYEEIADAIDDVEGDYRHEQITSTLCAHHNLERALNGAHSAYICGNNGAPKVKRVKLADKVRLLFQSEEWMEEERRLTDRAARAPRKEEEK